MHPENQVPKNPFPFFNLMAEAEEIRVQEVGKTALPPASVSEAERTFLVRLKGKPKEDLAPVGEVKEQSQDRSYLLRSADLLISNKDFVLARNVYSLLLKQDIRDKEALHGLGVCLFKLSEFLAAKKCFRALWELQHQVSSLIWLGKCLSAEGNDTGTVQYYQQIEESQIPDIVQKFEWLKEYGNALTRLGNYDEAKKKYFAALELKLEVDTVLVNLGTLEIQRKNWDVARHYYLEALKIAPKNARAHCGLGMVDFSVGDYFSAQTSFINSLDCDPQNLAAVLQLVQASEHTGARGEAKIRITKFLMREPKNAEARYALSAILFRQGDFRNSEKELDAALQIAPHHPRALKLKEDLTHNKPMGA